MRNESLAEAGNVFQRALLAIRLAVVSLFFAAAVRKLQGGAETIQKTVRFFQITFENIWLPAKLVNIHAYATPFVEALIVIWLISGFRLTAAWIFTALFTTPPPASGWRRWPTCGSTVVPNGSRRSCSRPRSPGSDRCRFSLTMSGSSSPYGPTASSA